MHINLMGILAKQTPSPPPVGGNNIFIISLGDSNIRGSMPASPLVDMSAKYQDNIPDVQIWETDQFKTLNTTSPGTINNQYPITQRQGGASFHLPYTIELLNKYSKVYHYTYGRGGSELAQWKPSASNYYDITSTELIACFAYFVTNEITIDKIIFILHLGTNDCVVDVSNIETDYKALINGYRGQFGVHETVLFQVGSFLSALPSISQEDLDLCRLQISNTVTDLSNMSLFNADSYPISGDGVHYTASSNEQIGKDLRPLYN